MCLKIYVQPSILAADPLKEEKRLRLSALIEEKPKMIYIGLPCRVLLNGR